MINFKIGILGTGSIAAKIAETIEKLDSFEIYAVASRDAARAENRKKLGIPMEAEVLIYVAEILKNKNQLNQLSMMD